MALVPRMFIRLSRAQRSNFLVSCAPRMLFAMPAYEYSTGDKPTVSEKAPVHPVIDSLDEEHPAVSIFRKYLQIKTEQPNPDYGMQMRMYSGFTALPFRELQAIPYQLCLPT